MEHKKSSFLKKKEIANNMETTTPKRSFLQSLQYASMVSFNSDFGKRERVCLIPYFSSSSSSSSMHSIYIYVTIFFPPPERLLAIRFEWQPPPRRCFSCLLITAPHPTPHHPTPPWNWICFYARVVIKK